MITRSRSGLAIALALSAAVAGRAWANDSSSELAAGGLVLTHNGAVEMRSEDLEISAKLVRVRYRFVNTSAHDVSVLVAFPMPDITTTGYDDVLSIPSQSPTNFLNFKTLVDGRPVSAQVEQKTIKNGVDRTAMLEALGVPLAPHLASTNAVINRLPPERQDELVRLGLAVDLDAGAAGPSKHDYATAWTLKTTFFWRQRFPAGREIGVEHRYRPSVGGSVQTAWGSDYWPKEPGYAAARKLYCVDDSLIAAARKAQPRAGTNDPYYSEERIGYVLTTGANWKAPIGEFHMVIDKGSPENLVSFCGDGVRRTGPTTFELRHKDFTPTKDVWILILRRVNPPAGKPMAPG